MGKHTNETSPFYSFGFVPPFYFLVFWDREKDNLYNSNHFFHFSYIVFYNILSLLIDLVNWFGIHFQLTYHTVWTVVAHSQVEHSHQPPPALHYCHQSFHLPSVRITRDIDGHYYCFKVTFPLAESEGSILFYARVFLLGNASLVSLWVSKVCLFIFFKRRDCQIWKFQYLSKEVFISLV